jgi:hypothetical protein
MLSLDLDEKTDIYRLKFESFFFKNRNSNGLIVVCFSFGIVAWEVLTGGNPFEQLTNAKQQGFY